MLSYQNGNKFSENMHRDYSRYSNDFGGIRHILGKSGPDE